MNTITIKRSWQGGPLRQFSESPFKGSIPVVGGHAGAYICDLYDHETPFDGEDGGVKFHDGRWLCAPCGERHEADKLSARRRKARLFYQTAKNQPKPLVLGRLFYGNALGLDNHAESDLGREAGCKFAVRNGEQK
ncbi:MAG: hypothetical protein ABSF66_06565 [Terriglobales bacterium]